MGENIKELLNEEIAAEIQAISSLDSGSEEKSKAIEDLAKLYRLRIMRCWHTFIRIEKIIN